MAKILLKEAEYTFSNAVLSGYSAGHALKADRSIGARRYVHMALVILESIPLLSRIISFAECAFAKGYYFFDDLRLNYQSPALMTLSPSGNPIYDLRAYPLRKVIKKCDKSAWKIGIVIELLSLTKSDQQRNAVITHLERVDFTSVNNLNSLGFEDSYKNISIFYHGTNSTVLESIQQHGLECEKRNFDTSEILKIAQIFQTKIETDFNNTLSAFVYSKRDFERKVVCLGQCKSNAVDYAFRSPEWFSRFVHAINTGTKSELYSHYLSKTRLEKLYNETHDKLKERVKGWISSNKIGDQEGREIVDFFNKYWKLYNKARPIVVISKRQNTVQTNVPRFEELDIKISPAEKNDYADILSAKNLEYYLL